MGSPLWFSVLLWDLRRILYWLIPRARLLVLSDFPDFAPLISSEDIEFSRQHLCNEAASESSLSLLQWARAQNCLWSEQTCEIAAEIGDLPMLQWLCAHGCPWYRDISSTAAYNGHLEMSQWIIEHGGCVDTFE